jgi:hypothetical protein
MAGTFYFTANFGRKSYQKKNVVRLSQVKLLPGFQ